MDGWRNLEQRSPVASEEETAACAEGGNEALMGVGRRSGSSIGRATSSLAAAMAVAAAVLGGHPTEDAISDQHTWKEVDQGSMARGDHPTIARRHCSLERDCQRM